MELLLITRDTHYKPRELKINNFGRVYGFCLEPPYLSEQSTFSSKRRADQVHLLPWFRLHRPTLGTTHPVCIIDGYSRVPKAFLLAQYSLAALPLSWRPS